MRVLETMRQHEVAEFDQYAFEDHPDHYSRHYRHNEQWRRVKGWEDYYSVSNHGRVRSEKSADGYSFPGCLLKVNMAGVYPIVQLNDGFRRQAKTVHSLVAKAFLGEPPTELHEVNHKDGNKANNRPSNLEWVTTQENIQHYWQVLRPMRTGVPYQPPRPKNQGNVHPRVATEIMVREMRKLWAAGVKPKLLAMQFNLKLRTVYSIVNWENWQHVG